MKKIIVTLWIFSLLIAGFSFQTVLAQDKDTSGLQLGSLIPAGTVTDCESVLKPLETSVKPVDDFKIKSGTDKNNILSCAIRTGRIHFWMIPYYVVYLIQFLIGIAGLLSVLFLVLGGFKYVGSGLSESKDKAKGTIKNALLGLGVALSAWAVVNLIQYIITF